MKAVIIGMRYSGGNLKLIAFVCFDNMEDAERYLIHTLIRALRSNTIESVQFNKVDLLKITYTTGTIELYTKMNVI